jgi:hypothetical protein
MLSDLLVRVIETFRISIICLEQEAKMKSKQSDAFRENAQHCANLAESAKDEPIYQRYKRMEAAWRALADEQDWLDGEDSSVGLSASG